jgi:hypothetical protein
MNTARTDLSIEEFVQAVDPSGLDFFNTVRYIQSRLYQRRWNENDPIVSFYFHFKFHDDQNFVLKGASFVLFKMIFRNLLAKELREDEGMPACDVKMAEDFFEEVQRKFIEGDFNESDTDFQFKITFDESACEWVFKVKNRNWNAGICVGYAPF